MKGKVNKYLVKISEDLKPHQKDALKKLKEQGGVILDHSTGSGKTLSFLKAVENLHKDKNKKALIIAPASLQTNVDKEIKHHNLKIDPSRLKVLSYTKAVNQINELHSQNYDLIIADESHNLRNLKTKRSKELTELITNAPQRMLATATMQYNKPSDIAPLLNMAHGKRVIVEDPKAFEKRYLEVHKDAPSLLKRILGGKLKVETKLKNEDELQEIMEPVVSHYDSKKDPEFLEHFPSKTEKVVEVEMSPEQQQVYKYMEGQLPWAVRMKVRANLPLDKREAAKLNSFSTAVRQASNSTSVFYPKMQKVTPKIHAAVKSLVESANKDKNFRGLVYSNYKEAGVNDYSKELTKAGIPHEVFNGELNKTEKDEMVKRFNAGKTKALLITSAGGEGLDLKGVKKIQILEPSWNASKITQVIGRGVRYNSHAHLPKSERKVEVEHYHSIFPKGIFGQPGPHSIDQYLAENSIQKDKLNDKIKDLLQ